MRKSSEWLGKWIYMVAFFIGGAALSSPAFTKPLPTESVIHLEGTTNTRDIGGYQTADLSTLRTGQIIRSDNLSRLTEDDFRKLEEMGLKTVVDLRTEQELVDSPTVWKGDTPPRFVHIPVFDSKNDWLTAQRKMMKKNRFTQEQSLEHMVKGYRMIAEEGVSSYQKLMEIVLDESNWPVLIHCTAGKDRSGIGVVLIMEALNVDHDTIMEEFLLTNEVSRIEDKAVFLSRKSKQLAKSDSFSKGVAASAWLPIVGVRAEMLEAFYTSVDEKYGSMDAFLNVLGVGQEARGALAASLTTEQANMAMAN